MCKQNCKRDKGCASCEAGKVAGNLTTKVVGYPVERIDLTGKRISKLVPDDILRRIIMSGDLDKHSGRRNGKSTGFILKLIGKCMLYPEQSFFLTSRTSKEAYHLQALANHWVDKMGLRYFEIKQDRDRVYITYKPFREGVFSYEPV